MSEEEIKKLWNIFVDLLRKTKREGIEELIEWLDSTDFKFAPASTQYHSSYQGGLLKHSLDVYYHMYDFKNFIDFFELSEDTIILTSLLHDICKVNTYVVSVRNKKDENGKWIQVPYYEWDDIEPIGHGCKSVMLMYEHGVKPTKTERAMIVNHMGFSVPDDRKYAGNLFGRCPQSLILHWADELATYVTEGSYLSDKISAKLLGRNLSECNIIKEQMDKENTITINGQVFKLAPEDSVVDNITVGELDLGAKPIKILLEQQQ